MGCGQLTVKASLTQRIKISHTTFAYYLPYHSKENKKITKYQYDTGTCGTLSDAAASDAAPAPQGALHAPQQHLPLGVPPQLLDASGGFRLDTLPNALRCGNTSRLGCSQSHRFSV